MLNSYNSSMYIFNDISFNARYFIIDMDDSIIALTTLVNNSPIETTTLLIMRAITWKSMEDSRDYSSWGCRVERSAYILETDVAVRHVLEMIVRVITWRYWRPRPRAILRSDASSGRRQFAYRRSRNLLLKNAYGKPAEPSPPRKIEPITSTLVLENFVEREIHRLSRAMRDITRHIHTRVQIHVHWQ